MRPPLRTHGRFAALSGMTTITGVPGDPFELVVVDRDGRPVPEPTEWYRLRKNSGPNRTRDTYLGYLLPVLSYFRDHEWDLLAPAADVRRHVLAFQQDVLHMTATPDRNLDGYRMDRTRDTPLSESGLRGLRAALRDFYEVMTEADLYPYPNPMDSQILKAMKMVRARQVENAGAPEHSGIRGEARTEPWLRPTGFFRPAHRDVWIPNKRLLMPDALHGLRAALDNMLRLSRNELADRERAVLLLLRYTGARVSEITDMTVGGYRSYTEEGVPNRALVKNKGSNDRESKEIDWTGNPRVQWVLRRYLKEERPLLDPQNRSQLANLADDDPFFLVRGGEPYNYNAFRWHWRRIYPVASRHCPVPFRIHDIRHLFVTEWLLRERRRYGKDSPSYADTRRTISQVMGWRGSLTIDAYDHSLDHAEAMGRLYDLQRDIAQQAYDASPAPDNTSITVENATVARRATPELVDMDVVETIVSDDLEWIRERMRHA